MRETCARVLAAALMTGAIASVVAMSALLNTPRDDGYALTAPPSSLQRSVRVPALAAPPRPARAERLAIAPSVRTPVVAASGVVRHKASRGTIPVPRPTLKPASAGRTTLKPPPPAPEPRQLASDTPPSPVPPPAQTPSPQPQAGGNSNEGKGKHGKAKGHDKGRGSDAEQSTAAP